VVNKVRWALDAKKAGHAGTLDPEATGVLAVALGEATKTVPYITDALKCYTFTVRLGQATNTDDAEGEVIASSDVRPTDDEIKAALGDFVGDILQVPPQFSAVKVDGVRAYKKARDGEEMELVARALWVDALLLIDRPDADHVTLEMTCGKGGYVRSIARDLGERLSCKGHVLQLRRIWSGPFDVTEGVTLERIEALAKTPELDAFILPLEMALGDMEQVICPAESIVKMRNGNAAHVIGSGLEFDQEVWASYEGEAVAVGNYRSGELHPSRVFVKAE
jgi:tRNA pseudouridine55 synthase